MECTRFDEKKWGMSLEQIQRSMAETTEDRLWFYDNLPVLRKKYMGKWVCVRAKQVIAADQNHDRLIAEVKQTPKGLAGVQILFVPPEDMIFVY